MRCLYQLNFVFIMVALNTNVHALDDIQVYEDIVKPVFTNNCTACHNSEDLQGGLDLSTVEGIQQGGAFGAVIQPGSAEISELVNRMTLPEEDELAMPPSGKERVSEENIRLIQWWVDSGASFDQTVNGEIIPDDIRAVLTTRSEDKKHKQELTSLNPVSVEDIQTVRNHGFEVRELAVGHPLLDVSIDPLKKKITKDDIDALSKITNNIAWLNLSRCGLNDEILKQLSAMPNLIKINLSQNKITAQSIGYLSTSPKLEVINLYQTQVGDDAIQLLIQLSNLKTLYLWDSKITKDGIQKVRIRYPTIKIIGDTD